MVITKIEQQKNVNRVNIFVDETFFCGLERETALIFGLKVGKEIDEKTLLDAIRKSEEKRAFEKAMTYITTRPHSKFEIKNKLKNKGYEDIVITNTLSKLEEYHFIDDNKFCELFIEQNSKLSKKRLFAKLMAKGIESEIIEYNLKDIDMEDELNACKIIAQKIIKSSKIETFSDKQKFIAKLGRRGFSYSVAKKAMEELDIDCSDEMFD